MKISAVLFFFIATLWCSAQNESVWSSGRLLSKKQIDLTELSYYKNTFTDGEHLLPRFAHLDSLAFYSLTFQSDDQIVEGFSIEPKYKCNLPVIIFNRGGNKEQGRLTIKSLIFATGKLASAGYVILASNYRNNDEFGGRDVQDVLSLIQITSAFDRVDTSRIGMFGWSRGGMMTYLAIKNSDRIKTAVVGNGVSNMFQSIEYRPEMEQYVYSKYIPNYWENKTEELTNRSVIFWVEDLSPNTSFLLLAGSNDQRVNPNQSKDLAEQLIQAGYRCELKTYPTNHAFRGYRDELNKVLIQWFSQNL